MALYGYNPLSKDDPLFERGERLQPALSLSSVIVSLNELKKGDGVSYGFPQWEWRDSSASPLNDRITATVPFGYFEGLPRRVKDKIFFRYQKVVVPQVGTICMNLCCCLGNQEMQIGDQIWLIEKEKNSELSLEHIANAAETIPYEILVKLDRGIRRVVE